MGTMFSFATLPRLGAWAVCMGMAVVAVAADPAQPTMPMKAAGTPSAEELTKAKNDARALWAEARKAEDLWTCLQLEAWGKAKALRLGPLLGTTSAVHGSALFGFPHGVHHCFDRGSWVGVISGDRYYRITPDGRPLTLSSPMPIGGQADVSFDGSWVARADAQGWSPEPRRIRMAVVGAPGGKVQFQHMHSVGGFDDYRGSLRVAHDGSAAIANIENSQDGSNRRLAIATVAGIRFVPGYFDASGIGPNAAWVLARRAGQGDDNVLLTTDGVRVVRDSAPGPGIASVLVRDADAGPWKAKLVSADGKLTDMTLRIGIGTNPEVQTVASWLVVCSGDEATTPVAVDLLGNPIEGAAGAPQPVTMSLYRWADLLANPLAEPVQQLPGRIQRSSANAPGLVLWNGPEISLLDLSSPDAPIQGVLAKVDVAVQDVAEQHGRYRVRCADRQWRILSADGKEVWRGQADWMDLQDRDWCLSWTGDDANRRYTVSRMSPDAAQRNDALLDKIPAGRWDVRIDRLGRRVIAERWNEFWFELDAKTGAVTDQARFDPINPRRAPGVWHIWDPPWRFMTIRGRMLSKVSGFEGDWESILAARDAYYVGPQLFVLSHFGGISNVVSRKGESWKDLGQVQGDHFSFDPDDHPLVVAGEGRRITAVIGRGPALVENSPMLGERAGDLDPGRWRVQNETRYTAPRASSAELNVDRMGFRPSRLRSGDAGGLLVVTESVVIELDVAAAKALSVTR